VRPGRPDDRQTLTALFAAAFSDRGYDDARVRDWLLDPQHVVWVAADGEAPAHGCVVLRIGDDAIEVAAIAVEPGRRGEGVGGALLDLAIEIAEREGRFWGLDALSLHVAEGAVAARALFERAGFVRVPAADARYGTGVVALALHRPIQRRRAGFLASAGL
jgi:ribosomal protein S18 acetylase RimI-like enzyme